MLSLWLPRAAPLVRPPHLFPLGQKGPFLLGPDNQQGQPIATQEALLQDPACLGVPCDHLSGQDEAPMEEHSHLRPCCVGL